MTPVLPELLRTLSETFPCFQAIPMKDWTSAQPELRTFPAKSTVFHSGEAITHAFFLLQGTVQISNVTEGGREALSARLSAGDICALMVLSGLSEREYPGVIMAETEVTALFIAKKSFLHWVQAYAPVRNAVFGNILEGLIRMGSLLSANMSRPLDSRLAEALAMLTSEHQPTIRITHQELAVKLGSAREVVSRVLSRMAKKGWIETGRGRVTVLQRSTLTDFVGDQVTEGRQRLLVR